MILSTKGRYAVMAMVELALHRTESPVRVALIAERQEIPLAYLEQIFAKLKRNGLIQSVRGPGGGYTLGRPAGLISMAEIIVAAEESIKMTRCGGTEHVGCMAPRTRCLTHDLWEGLGQQIYTYLSSLTLEDVASGAIKTKFPRDKKTSAHVTMFAEMLERDAAQV